MDIISELKLYKEKVDKELLSYFNVLVNEYMNVHLTHGSFYTYTEAKEEIIELNPLSDKEPDDMTADELQMLIDWLKVFIDEIK